MDQFSLEPLAPGVLLGRYHPDGGHGSPYSFVCCVLQDLQDQHRARIVGACGQFSLRVLGAIRLALESRGISEVTWERKKGNDYAIRLRSAVPTAAAAPDAPEAVGFCPQPGDRPHFSRLDCRG
jgi:hypothetical protein